MLTITAHAENKKTTAAHPCLCFIQLRAQVFRSYVVVKLGITAAILCYSYYAFV